MAATLSDNLIDRQMVETGLLGEQLAVASFAYARRTGHNDVWILSRHDAQLNVVGLPCGGRF